MSSSKKASRSAARSALGGTPTLRAISTGDIWPKCKIRAEVGALWFGGVVAGVVVARPERSCRKPRTDACAPPTIPPRNRSHPGSRFGRYPVMLKILSWISARSTSPVTIASVRRRRLSALSCQDRRGNPANTSSASGGSSAPRTLPYPTMTLDRHHDGVTLHLEPRVCRILRATAFTPLTVWCLR